MIHSSDFLWITSEIAFATTRSACTDGCSSSNLPRTPIAHRQHSLPTAKHGTHRDSPEEAVLVRPRRVRAHPRVARALVQLEHARVHRAGDVERRSPVQIQLRTRIYVREEGVRVEEAYRTYSEYLPLHLCSV